jgi:hypothetical protein
MIRICRMLELNRIKRHDQNLQNVRIDQNLKPIQNLNSLNSDILQILIYSPNSDIL